MKLEKIIVVLAVIFLLGYLHDGWDLHSTKTKQDSKSEQNSFSSYTTPAYTVPAADTYTPTQAPYSGHILMDARGMGDCKSLTGDLLINIVLVDDRLSRWTEADAWDFHNDVLSASDKMVSEAAEWGVYLNVQLNYLSCYVDDTMDISDFHDWVTKALYALNLPETDTIAKLQDMYQVEKAALIFAVNRDGRSFATPQNWNQGLEYAVLHREHGDYRHELYHVYGAKDYYYPDILKTYAAQYFPDSIMLETTDNAVTDSLTAYLIGWTDYLSDNARSLLDASAWITPEYLTEAYYSEIITGYATIRHGDGTYTGYLDDGIPNGVGTMVWDNGNYYKGDWVNGSIEGYGTFIWNSGDYYEGNWVNGTMEGYGTFIWAASNNRYTGYFRNGLLDGYGTYTYPDGRTSTGQWRDNEFVG